MILYAIPPKKVSCPVFPVQIYNSVITLGCQERQMGRQRDEQKEGGTGGGRKEGRKPKNYSKVILSLAYHTNSSAHPLGSNSSVSKTPHFSM